MAQWLGGLQTTTTKQHRPTASRAHAAMTAWRRLHRHGQRGTALGRHGNNDGVGQAAASQGRPTLARGTAAAGPCAAQPMHSAAERSGTRARAR